MTSRQIQRGPHSGNKADKQTKKKLTVFLTGATGIVGSDLMLRLTGEGHRVICLVRGRDDRSAEKRLAQIVGSLPAGCDVISGNLTDYRCGLSDSDLEALKTRTFDLMVHSAASTSMDFNEAREIALTNVRGTKNALALARHLGIRDIKFVSTAYVENGDSNPYETTKREAEHIVKRFGLNYTICRLSIVIGNSKDGHINGFSGYYALAKAFHTISKHLQKDEEDFVTVPMDLKIAENIDLNLIPIDWACHVLTEIIKMPSQNKTIFITHPHPPKLKDVFDESLKILKVRLRPTGSRRPRFKYSRLLKRSIQTLYPYITKDIRLKHNVKEFLNGSYVQPPRIDSGILEKVLSYATAREFGCVD